MNQGIRTVIYPVKDIAQAKTLYSKLLGREPYMDEAYYVGFKVGDQESRNADCLLARLYAILLDIGE
jgi:hypothetical protein